MQNKVIVSVRANKDMEEIGDFISIDNKSAASKLIDDFENSFKRLAQMPKAGYRRPDWAVDENIRFCNVKSYVIVYKINEKNIIILRILSTYRDIAGLLN